MFQDEARFGRVARIRRCWSPALIRPVVDNGHEREFTYVYGTPWVRSEVADEATGAESRLL